MSAVDLLLDVIRKHSRAAKWVGAPLESFRQVENTNRGAIGEEFVRRYLRRNRIPVDNGSRVTRTDLTVRGRKLEVKTASEDVKGAFQFNHIRHDRKNQYLLCLGVTPSEILFNAWRKGDVAEGKAGTLARMAEGQSVTFKLTKKRSEMLPIRRLPAWIRANLR